MEFRHDPFSKLFENFERMMYDDYPFFYTRPFFGNDNRLLPSGDTSGQITSYKRPNLDVQDVDNEVVVKVDLPGVDKENVKVRLVNPRTLEVSCQQGTDKEDKKENYYIRERTYGYMKRLVSLPSDVTDIDSKISFKNGVLDLTFKKIQIAQKEYLKLE